MQETPSIGTNVAVPPFPLWQRITLPQVALATALVALTLLAVYMVVELRNVFMLLFLGIVVATALAPIAERLRRLGVGRAIATLIAFSLLILLVVGIMAAVVPFFITQTIAVLEQLPGSYSALRGSLQSSPFAWLRGVAVQLPVDPAANLAGGISLTEILANQVPTVGTGIVYAILVLLISYYWLSYRDQSVRSLALLVPRPRRAAAVQLWRDIETKIGAFVRGLAIMGVAIGLLSGIGYWLIGLPYAFIIAVIAALLEVIPYIGPFVTMLLAVLVGFSVSPTLGLLTLAVALTIQLFEGYVVVPRVMDRAVGVHPVITLLALGVFADLFGLLGAILAIPLAAALQVVGERLLVPAALPEELPSGGLDQAAQLRQQARDVISFVEQRVRAPADGATAGAELAADELEALLQDLEGILAVSKGRQV